MSEWTWNETPRRREGVSYSNGRLVWFVQTLPGYGDLGTDQSAEAFLRDGPPVTGVPAEVLRELRELLGEP